PRAAEYGEIGGEFGELLARLQIQPFKHQVTALKAVQAGENLMIGTPTASGKSLVYQLPMLSALRSGGSFLYLAPTKALTEDQLLRVRELRDVTGIDATVARYDGDT